MKLYQHFKGGLYVTINNFLPDVTNDAPEGQMFVAYSCMISGLEYVREFSEFHENVEYKGKTGPRFRVIADPADIMPEGGHP